MAKDYRFFVFDSSYIKRAYTTCNSCSSLNLVNIIWCLIKALLELVSFLLKALL